jgi:hypothetical protein
MKETVMDDVQRLEAERLRPVGELDPVGDMLRRLVSVLAEAARDAGWY